jgi:hypothetical protein
MQDKATSPYLQRIKRTLYIHIVYLIGIEIFPNTLLSIRRFLKTAQIWLQAVSIATLAEILHTGHKKPRKRLRSRGF